MKIVGIFGVVEESLFAVRFDDKAFDEFKDLFDKWQDIEYLEQFFEDNKHDLKNGIYQHISLEEAVEKTAEEVFQFEQTLRKAAFNSAHHPNAKLTLESVVFKSLHKDILDNEYIQSKAYGNRHKSWLRIYAIRLDRDIYFISGGGIKLTKTMQESEHLKLELLKIEKVKEYLKENFIVDEADLGTIELESYEEE